MILALPHDVRARLDAIERVEGVPPVELAHQAISVWSHLDAQERHRVGLVAMQIVMERARR